MKMIESDKVAPLFRLLLMSYPKSVVDSMCEDIQTIIDAHTVDAIKVVRCADCKHYYPPVVSRDSGICVFKDRDELTEHDGYCSYGERRKP